MRGGVRFPPAPPSCSDLLNSEGVPFWKWGTGQGESPEVGRGEGQGREIRSQQEPGRGDGTCAAGLRAQAAHDWPRDSKGCGPMDNSRAILRAGARACGERPGPVCQQDHTRPRGEAAAGSRDSDAKTTSP